METISFPALEKQLNKEVKLAYINIIEEFLTNQDKNGVYNLFQLIYMDNLTLKFKYADINYLLQATLLTTQEALIFETFIKEAKGKDNELIEILTVVCKVEDHPKGENKNEVSIMAKFISFTSKEFYIDHINKKYCEAFIEYVIEQQRKKLRPYLPSESTD